MKTIRTKRGRDAVATYATANGAAQAVSHLVTLGYDEDDVGIAPRDFAPVDAHPLRRRVILWLRFGGIVGATGAAALEVGRRIGADTLWQSVVPTILAGAALGLAAGVVAGVIVHRRARSHTFDTSPSAVAPQRFEVVVRSERDRARHGLAKWWEPTAPPTQRQQSA